MAGVSMTLPPERGTSRAPGQCQDAHLPLRPSRPLREITSAKSGQMQKTPEVNRNHSPGRLAKALTRAGPHLVIEPNPEDGPVLVTVTFRINPERAQEFIRAAYELGRVRRRDGAVRWALFADPFDPSRYMETYVVESWLARQRQLERFTVADHAIRNRVFSFHTDAAPPVV